VFSVMYMANKYEIADLLSSMRKYVADFPITDENVVDVATCAMAYWNTFHDDCKEILTTCTNYLRPKFHNPSSAHQFLADNKERKEIVNGLLELMDEMKGVASYNCMNCFQTPCRDGTGVQEREFWVGLVVVQNMGSGYWVGESRGKGRVNRVLGDVVTVEDVAPETLYGHEYPMSQSGNPVWLYSCN